VLDHVLDTTLELLAEHGYGFGMEDVARRAGVHKTTVYRRWPTKPALIAAAAQRLAQVEIAAERTDDPVADLTALALGVAAALRTGGGIGALRAVLAAAGDDPEMVPTARAFLTGRYRVAEAIVEDAIAQGRFREDVDPTVVWEAIVNPMHLRAILGAPASDRVARQLVDVVVRGASAAR
jgi:AcrR family transcriptional regulator